MTYTATTIYGKRREARLEPWLDEKGDLARLGDAIGQMFQLPLELAEEEGEDGSSGYIPAYGRLLDPVLCPNKALAYLMQFIGLERMKEETEAEARATLKRAAGTEKGTLRSIEEAIKKVLGTGKFTIQERTAKSGAEAAYHFNVLVEIGKSSKALEEAIESVKPGGLQFSVLELKNPWLVGAKKWSEVPAGKTWTTIKEGEY